MKFDDNELKIIFNALNSRVNKIENNIMKFLAKDESRWLRDDDNNKLWHLFNEAQNLTITLNKINQHLKEDEDYSERRKMIDTKLKMYASLLDVTILAEKAEDV